MKLDFLVMEMMRFNRFSLWFLLPILIGMPAGPVWAKPNINVVVKTVLASQGEEHSDPRLSTLIGELQSVFRYSSYQLLREDPIGLAMRETGVVPLPGDRVLKITPRRIAGNRVELKLVILKKKKQIFQTVIQLLNHGSIIVGGPKYKDGFLLFNISTSF